MHRRNTCAFLIDYYGGDYQLGLMKGVEDAAIGYDDNLVVAVGRWLQAPNPIDAAQNSIYRQLRQPGTDAIIAGAGCLSHFVSAEQLGEFYQSFSPLPLVSISVHVPGTPSLVVDNRRGQQVVVEHLILAHGCRNIAYIRGPLTSFEARERFEGYQTALRLHRIAFDPALVHVGNFWVNSGAEGVEALLKSGVKFDALVAANDYMALGVMDALKSRGIRVPEDMRIVGFDDVPSARMTTPSLTTVRQPLQRMGARALQLVHATLEGASVADCESFDVDLIRRQSCGCGYRASHHRSLATHEGIETTSLDDFLAMIPELEAKLLDAVSVPSDQWPSVIKELLEALVAEFSGNRGRFLVQLSAMLERNRTRVDLMDQFGNIIEALRAKLRFLVIEGHSVSRFENLWHSSILQVSEWISRSLMRSSFELERSNENLRASIERLSTALTNASLSESISAIIPTTAIASSCLGLQTGDDTEQLRVFAVTGTENSAALLGKRYAASELAPPGFLSQSRRSTFVLMPLTHGSTSYGQALVEAGDHCAVYSMLREQIGAALKAADMHRVVVEETSRRERAERERIERETEIAQQIQTAILPQNFQVSGLDIAAVMHPATSVGGDYYDVIPTEGGCYLGIGDVTGHGLLSGMIMLMVQSMIAGAVQMNTQLTPSEILPAINRALFDNVRHRLHGTDHVTLTLLKYWRDGRLLLAGAHEDILLCRRRTGRCEAINVPGFWLAAIPDVTAMTRDIELQLEDGDLLVLYTDGVTESMNESHEQYGLVRLMATIERHTADPPSRICEWILESLKAWSTTQLDDITLLVARFDAAAGPGLG